MQKFLKTYKMALYLIHFKAVALSCTAFGLSVLLFLFSILCTTTTPSYSQLLQPGASDHLLTSSSSSQKSTHPDIHAVKIISPADGQQVQIGKNLVITGTSLANATSNCQISIGLNRVKPYQTATAAGPSEGATDYSKWNFTLTPKYTTIKEGPNNKITAKYTCSNDPSLESYNSVNVTGVVIVSAHSPVRIQHQQQERQQPVTAGNRTIATSSELPTGIPGLP